MRDYWEQTIDEAFEDAGITATKEQRETVASWVEGNHDNYGLAHGHDAIPNPLATELDRARRELRQEQAKTQCPDCDGGKKYRWDDDRKAYLLTGECWTCDGKGWIQGVVESKGD